VHCYFSTVNLLFSNEYLFVTVLVDVDDSPHVTNKYSFENNKLTVLK
jgi:hypothetical protein